MRRTVSTRPSLAASPVLQPATDNELRRAPTAAHRPATSAVERTQERDQIERQSRTQIASFLNDDGRQRELRDRVRCLREPVASDFENTERIVLRGVEPERD